MTKDAERSRDIEQTDVYAMDQLFLDDATRVMSETELEPLIEHATPRALKLPRLEPEKPRLRRLSVLREPEPLRPNADWDLATQFMPAEELYRRKQSAERTPAPSPIARRDAAATNVAPHAPPRPAGVRHAGQRMSLAKKASCVVVLLLVLLALGRARMKKMQPSGGPGRPMPTLLARAPVAKIAQAVVGTTAAASTPVRAPGRAAAERPAAILPAKVASSRHSNVTLARSAADAVEAGNSVLAAQIYRQIASQEPEAAVYPELVRMLERRGTPESREQASRVR